jgi:hypothetical protein
MQIIIPMRGPTIVFSGQQFNDSWFGRLSSIRAMIIPHNVVT